MPSLDVEGHERGVRQRLVRAVRRGQPGRRARPARRAGRPHTGHARSRATPGRRRLAEHAGQPRDRRLGVGSRRADDDSVRGAPAGRHRRRRLPRPDRPSPDRQRLRRAPRPADPARAAAARRRGVGALRRRRAASPACHVGANLVPVEAGPEDAAALRRAAARARPHRVHDRRARDRPSARSGTTSADAWGPPRETRWRQPHLVADAPPLIEPDPLVRASRPDDFAALYPACVAMYTEELGVSPELGGGAEGYRARVRQLIHVRLVVRPLRAGPGRLQGRGRVRDPDQRPGAGRLGHPRPPRRGPGRGRHGGRRGHVRARIAPVVSLYVNDWNEPARRAYAKVGFHQTDTFSTIMF